MQQEQRPIWVRLTGDSVQCRHEQESYSKLGALEHWELQLRSLGFIFL